MLKPQTAGQVSPPEVCEVQVPNRHASGQNAEVLANARVLTGEGWSRAVKGQQLMTFVL